MKERLPRSIQEARALGYQEAGWQNLKEVFPNPNVIQRSGKAELELDGDGGALVEVPFTATIRYGKPRLAA